MKSILKEWIFINFCGQKIGQFKGANIISSTINSLLSQMLPLVQIPIFYIYISMGFRSLIIFIIILIISIIIIRSLIKLLFKDLLTLKELEFRYKGTQISKRFLYFFIAILFTGGSVILLGYSMSLVPLDV